MPRDLGPSRKIAVVLINLGGPDRLESVRPFLFNLFSDRAIIGLPWFLRYPLASLISRLRERSAQANYARMGGASPLLSETEAQAGALLGVLTDRLPSSTVRVFVAMRYWNPLSDETSKAVDAFQPDDVVILPLYPQFSTTTTASSLAAWRKAYKGSCVLRAVCCYPLMEGFIEAHADRIRQAWSEHGGPKDVRVLFSAHGLPEKVIEGGDPYQAQVEATAAAVASRLGPAWDWQVCYQSRVGPMKWLGPTTPDAIREAAKQGLGVVITPIAFVSEHIETLVELDHEYALLAEAIGCPHYIRVPALGTEPAFIQGLADSVVAALAGPVGLHPGSGYRCPTCLDKCATRATAGQGAS